MRAAWAVMIGLAAGYVALALYGKVRRLREDYRRAVEEERRRGAAGSPERGGPERFVS